MAQKPASNDRNGRGRPNPSTASGATASEVEYKVGPGHPPKEYRFKPGQSGNPKGAKPKAPSIAPDLKKVVERALDKKVTLRQGEKERTVTMFEAGVEQLVNLFAKGDRHARRDLFDLAERLGIDLMNQHKAIEEALVSNHQAILDAFVDRQYDRVKQRAPELAPAELLDDDTDDQTRK